MTETWNEAVPAGSDNPKQGDDVIRSFKIAMRERLAEDHQFEASESPAFGATGYKIGKHNYVTLIEQASDKTTLANEIAVYAKDTGSNPEIYIQGENDATTKQFTDNDTLTLAADWLSGVQLNEAGSRPIINTGIGINGSTYSLDFPTNNLNTGSMLTLTGDSDTVGWWRNATAPPGWKALAVEDQLLAVAGGSQAYSGQAGNSDVGDWELTGVTTENESSHTHDEGDLVGSLDTGSSSPVGTDELSRVVDDGGDLKAATGLGPGATLAQVEKTVSLDGGDTGTGTAHNHGVAHDATDRPLASVGLLCQFDTA